MESFQTCAIQMLKEFRALLHISPITINSHRLLQLISLNMYSIACTELKGESRWKSIYIESLNGVFSAESFGNNLPMMIQWNLLS
jgi:hypothetical protein